MGRGGLALNDAAGPPRGTKKNQKSPAMPLRPGDNAEKGGSVLVHVIKRRNRAKGIPQTP